VTADWVLLGVELGVDLGLAFAGSEIV
jgi:hypothetical protein